KRRILPVFTSDAFAIFLSYKIARQLSFGAAKVKLSFHLYNTRVSTVFKVSDAEMMLAECIFMRLVGTNNKETVPAKIGYQLLVPGYTLLIQVRSGFVQ